MPYFASLTHLLETPAQYGVTWNVQVYANQENPTQKVARELVSAVRGDPRVSAFGLGTTGLPLSVNGLPADALAVFNHPGGVEPPILAGRAPAAAPEIALGPKTLDQLHKRMGDTVKVSVFGSVPRPMGRSPWWVPFSDS